MKTKLERRDECGTHFAFEDRGMCWRMRIDVSVGSITHRIRTPWFDDAKIREYTGDYSFSAFVARVSDARELLSRARSRLRSRRRLPAGVYSFTLGATAGHGRNRKELPVSTHRFTPAGGIAR